MNDPLSQGALDRAGVRRGDADWIAARLADETSLFVPVWRGKVLLRNGDAGEPRAAILTLAAARRVVATEAPWAFLGLVRDAAVFAVDISATLDPIALLPAESGEFGELRPIVGLLPAADAAVLGHARALLHWRERHRFCGVCGGGCEPAQAGNTLICTACGTHHFPRTDPAVIMLVGRIDDDGVAQVLLAHSPRFPSPDLYTVLAGFVEPGENLEQAVAREVMEETSVAISDVRYFGSQSWPFPSSVMLGFTARATSRDIVVDPSELTDAQWFPKQAIHDPAAYGIALPHQVTIARQLLEAWARASDPAA